MTSSDPIVIIGTGLAGYNLAREIRRHDKSTPLVLITQDDGAYYSKPSLSTAFSQGKTMADLVVHTGEAMALQLQAELLPYTTVESIDSEHKTLRCHNDRVITYRSCVLACGTTPAPLPVEGPQDRVIHVNSLEDYHHLCQRLAGVKRVLILGSGLIGSEFANDLSKYGLQVTFVSKSITPLIHLLPAEAGKAVIDSLTEQGVTFVGGSTATKIEESGTGARVYLSNGQMIEADLIISAIGLRVNKQLAEYAGIRVNRGICVDRFLRTSDPHIYAIGDCAEIEGYLLQFVMPLMHQSRALGATLTGTPTQLSYPCMPVSVKTACSVTTVMPHEPEGIWSVEGNSPNFKALCKNKEGQLIGWALTGDYTQERRELTGLVGGLWE